MKLYQILILPIPIILLFAGFFALSIYLLFSHFWMFVALMIAGVIGTILLIKYSSTWEK